jgi:hypothetical protein
MKGAALEQRITLSKQPLFEKSGAKTFFYTGAGRFERLWSGFKEVYLPHWRPALNFCR